MAVKRRDPDQLTFLTAIGQKEDKARQQDYLATPLSKEEQRRFGRMYAEHIGLIRMFGGRMVRKFWFLDAETIFSLADIAFLRACRAWQPERGAFSTCLGVFVEGEIKHWIRDNGFALKAPGKVREIGARARRLIQDGASPDDVCEQFRISREELKDALLATAGLAHDVKGFDLHLSTYPTPWEVLERELES